MTKIRVEDSQEFKELEMSAHRLGYRLDRLKTEEDWYSCGCGEYIQYKYEDTHNEICEG